MASYDFQSDGIAQKDHAKLARSIVKSIKESDWRNDGSMTSQAHIAAICWKAVLETIEELGKEIVPADIAEAGRKAKDACDEQEFAEAYREACRALGIEKAD